MKCAREGCDVEFDKKYTSQKYCSRTCTTKAGIQRFRKKMLEQNPLKEKRCKKCGSIFHSNNKNKIFCTRLCSASETRDILVMQNNLLVRLDRCPHCRSLFKRKANKRFCSRVCGRASFHARRYVAHKLIRAAIEKKIRCKCGVEFISNKPKITMCSECKKIEDRNYARAWRLANKALANNYAKKWRDKNKGRHYAKIRLWVEKNRELVREYGRSYLHSQKIINNHFGDMGMIWALKNRKE